MPVSLAKVRVHQGQIHVVFIFVSPTAPSITPGAQKMSIGQLINVAGLLEKGQGGIKSREVEDKKGKEEGEGEKRGEKLRVEEPNAASGTLSPGSS